MSTNSTLSQPANKEREPLATRSFTLSALPWIVAAGALVFYLLTLNHWISFGNLTHVAKISGFTWNAELAAPLYLLVTYPLRWLPPQYVPFALNFFAAICAALVLALLARSVALLPHDRTVAQRERERSEFALLSIRTSWAPAVLAVLVCGLQMSFWENATAAGTSSNISPSGHMFDLLIFAYVVRSLLEYRVSEDESWLTRASLLMGASMTNDWAMLGYFPLFIATLMGIKGLSFFNAQFLGRMFFRGLAGLSLYLLLPFVYAFFSNPEVPFVYSLKWNLGTQLYYLKVFWGYNKTLLLLSLTSLLPVIFMTIRWSSQFGDTSRMGAGLAKLVIHVFHGFFLFACIWVAMDPAFSPRNENMGVPFLSFYYLGALAIGYMAGYFLLVFAPKRSSRFARYVPGYQRLLDNTVIVGIWALTVAAPIALLVLNLPRIRTVNGPLLREYALALANGLPQGPTLILSDDPRRLVLLQSVMAGNPKERDYVYLDSGFLTIPAFHSYAARRWPQRWPSYLGTDRTKPVDEVRLIDLLASMSATNRVFYLHPSFGYYFEVFYPEPHGIASELKLYPTNAAMPPPISDEVVKYNQEFWENLSDNALAKLADVLGPAEPGRAPTLAQTLVAKAHLKHPPHADAISLGSFYSQSLTFWGGQLQTKGMFKEARGQFALAQKLNANNVVARINQEYTDHYLAGKREPLTISKNLEEAFGRYSTWDQVLTENGPYEEPGMCYSQGRLFQDGRNYRQAAQQYARARALYPEHGPATLALANLYLVRGMPQPALALLEDLQRIPSFMNQVTNLSSVVLVHSSAHLMNGDEPAAEAVVARALERATSAETNVTSAILESAVYSFIQHGSYGNALKFAEQLLSFKPEDPAALANKGYLCVQLRRYTDAVPPLTKALTHKTNDRDFQASGHLNRGIANLRLGNLDGAREDYDWLLKKYGNWAPVHYGLGEIAYRKGNTNEALQCYTQYLKLAPEDSEETKSVRTRVEQLTGAAK